MGGFSKEIWQRLKPPTALFHRTAALKMMVVILLTGLIKTDISEIRFVGEKYPK